jgi:hypothetical protein
MLIAIRAAVAGNIAVTTEVVSGATPALLDTVVAPATVK